MCDRRHAMGLCILPVILLGACRDDTSTESSPWGPTFQPVDGVGNLQLGSHFESVIGHLSEQRLNAAELARCYSDLPLEGCVLTLAGTPPYKFIDGVPLGLRLVFDSHGRLSVIMLEYRHGKGIGPLACRDLFERLLDWSARTYGPVYRSALNGGEQDIQYTRADNSYATIGTGMGSWETVPMRNLNRKAHPKDATRPIDEWSALPYVSPTAQYGPEGCLVSMAFKDPTPVGGRR